MDGAELWSSLCHNLAPMIKLGAPEEMYQQQFEAQLKIPFGWDESGMQRKVSIPVGSAGKLEGDIVLSGHDTKLVIEMKKPGITLTEKQDGQLRSYMKLIGARFGLLVGDRIKVYYDDDSTGETVEVADIPFNLKSEEGADFATTIAKSNFTESRLREFCVKQIKRAESAREMAELKDLLLADGGQRIKEIVKAKLIQDRYKETKINALLSDIKIERIGIEAANIVLPKNKPRIESNIFYQSVGINTSKTSPLRDKSIGKVKLFSNAQVAKSGAVLTREIAPGIHFYVNYSNVDGAEAFEQYKQFIARGEI